MGLLHLDTFESLLLIFVSEQKHSPFCIKKENFVSFCIKKNQLF